MHGDSCRRRIAPHRTEEGSHMSPYALISSDSHIIDPPDLWPHRIARAFPARAPRLIHEAEADQWYADGVTFGALGINQQAGVRFETPEALTLQGRMATVPRGGDDPPAPPREKGPETVGGARALPAPASATPPH